MEITYHWEGDYLIPDLKLSDTTEYHIGKYGRMRQRFLQENHRGIYSHMLLSETLYLAEVDEECNEMMDRLVGQMAKKEGVTDCIKNANDGILHVKKLLMEVLINAKIFYKKRCYRKATVRLG